MDQVRALLEHSAIQAAAIAIGSIVAAFLAELILVKVIGRIARRTRTTIDDEIVEICRRPVFASVLFGGAWWVAFLLEAGPRALRIIEALLISFAIVLWSIAAFAISSRVLRAMSARARRQGHRTLVQPRTIPVFDMMIKIGVIAASVYFFLLVWQIDATAWVASAGIAGIALGFAAKDTLANLFAGIFIVADAPYKVGDFIVLEGELRGGPIRGRVTSIGIRSTRVLTQDDVEVTVPNAIIGNSKIINEVGGPTPTQRVAVDVQAAYGSDIDRVEAALLEAAEGVELVSAEPKPRVRFRSFGDSGLDFRLLVWLDEAARREELVHILNTRIYKGFAAAGISIPFPQRDVWIKEAPGSGEP